MNISIFPRSIWPVLLLLLAGCSQTSLLTKQDYQNSQHNFVQGKVNDALVEFPRRAEQDTFITTMEKGYLSLIQGKPQIKKLQQQADKLSEEIRELGGETASRIA